MNDSHPPVDVLREYAVGLMSEAAASDLERHLAECRQCEATLDDLAATSETLIDALRRPRPRDPLLQEPELQAALAGLARDSGAASAAVLGPQGAALDEQIGVYRLLEKLGEGGMGAVYKALHTRLEKVVALKVLRGETLRDPAAVSRFEREMKAVGKLDHPHIVRALDAGEADGRHFLATEYIQGCDLAVLARRLRPFPIREACELVRQAALGLQAAHERGLVHRDVKPANLVLAAQPGGPPVVKLLDLGLALFSDVHLEANDGLTGAGQIMGTLDYMAPEQAGDTHGVDIRADVYSLGATLYRLLTGDSVYGSERPRSVLETLSALANRPAPPIQSRRADVPDALAAIVHRMLEKAPAARFSTPVEVARALGPLAEGADLARLLARAESGLGEAAPTGASPSASSQGLREGTIETDAGAAAAPNVYPTASLGPAAAVCEPTVDAAGKAVARRLGRRRTVAVLAALLAGAGLLVWGVVFKLRTADGTLVIELDDPRDIVVEVDGRTATVQLGADGRSVELSVAPGTRQLVVRTADGTVLRTDGKQPLEIAAGETQRIRAWVEPPDDAAVGDSPPAPRAPWTPTPEQQAFFDAVAALRAEEQVQQVRNMLQEVNPQFDGNVEHNVEARRVVEIRFTTDDVSDIWPVRALPELRVVECCGSAPGKGALENLSPLAGMPLRKVWCWNNRMISDLAPLEGMRLTGLNFSSTSVTDLAPVRRMRLGGLGFYGAPISDLSPLEGMQLTELIAGGSDVSDLSSLRGMNLTLLEVQHTAVSDLSPLAGMPLTHLNFWGARVTDLSPLEGMPLVYLYCGKNLITDLSPLRGMKLEHLSIGHCEVSDLSPVAGMPLRELSAVDSPVSDLSPLQGMQLARFDCWKTRVWDLTPLRGMPLTHIMCYGSLVSDLSPLSGMPLLEIWLDFPLYDEQAEAVLRSLPLQTINGPKPWEPDPGQPAAEFWEDVEARRKAAEEFAASLARFPPDQQVVAVVAQLRKLNDDGRQIGELVCESDDGAVTAATLDLTDWTQDVTPLMAFTRLRKLTLTGGPYWLDASPLKFLPLEELECSDDIALKNGPTLRALATLRTINGRPAGDYWRQHDAQPGAAPAAQGE